MEQSKKYKLEFIKSQNIPVVDHINNVEDIYNLALVKETSKLSCFGYIDPTNNVCKACYFNENGQCKSLAEHLSKIANSSYDNVAVRIQTLSGKEFKMDSFDSILSKLTVRHSSNEFKMCKVVLELASQNKLFNDVLAGIGKIIESDDQKKQQVYFYKVRKRLKDEAGINIEIVVYKYVSIIKGT